MKTGDIVLIPFPFSELTQVKLRPAIVITVTKDKFKDLVLCAVSSQVSAVLSSVEIIINPDTSNGLRVKSVIKVDRIFTLKSEKVVAKTGELSAELLNNFKNIFKSLVDD
jgi:mRNA interferase MazF